MVVARTNSWQTYVFVSPCLMLAMLGMLQISMVGVVMVAVFAYCAVAVLMGCFARYWALCLGLILWVGIGIGLANVLLPVMGIAVAGALAVVLVFWAILQAIRIGTVWGQDRAEGMRVAGHPIREWEWVYTGRDFALSHPLAVGLGPVWSVLGFVILQWGVIGWATLMSGLWVGFVLYSVIAGLVVWGLLRHHPSAWVLTWWPLLIGFPLSLPLIIYWADGVRPNLIYRHRFERLVPLENAHVH